MRAEYPCLASPPPSPRVHGPLCDLFGWGEAVAGIAQGVATITAAEKQANAARDAAKISADAANHGADLKDAEAQRAEAFLREQADYTGQQTEIDRHANYDQYAANRRRVGSISQALGLGGVEVPQYVAGVTPHFAHAPAPGTSPAPGGPPPAPPPDMPTAPAAGPANFGGPMTMGGFPLPPGATTAPANFGAALTGGPPPPGAPPIDPRLMAGNTGVTGGMTEPQLQPDGTYAMVPSMPPPRYRNFGQYLGAA